MLWSDVEHQGGATFVARDSVGPVARYLADHPEGVLPTEFPTRDLVGQCTDFAEATGTVGDVFLLHPFILHAKAQNTRRLPGSSPIRRSTWPNRCGHRPDHDSLVELAILAVSASTGTNSLRRLPGRRRTGARPPAGTDEGR